MLRPKNFNDLNRHLIEKYGERVEKICIDGGFTCPNRDGRCGIGGCTFCGNEGAGEFNEHGDIADQVRHALVSLRNNPKSKANRFIAYFQSFTGTYAPADILRKKYEEALCDERIIILSVGTRPDCLPEKTVSLLSSFRSQVDVWVELGLQTADDETAKRINRCYPTKVFEDAVRRLDASGLEVIVHMIIGLPGENHTHLERTVSLINSLPVSGVKIHSLYVMKGTRLGDEYLRGDFCPISFETYMEELLWTLEHLRPDIVIHRVTGDCPRKLFLAPEWALSKRHVLNTLINRMWLDNRHQGDLYGGNDGKGADL